MTKKDEPKRYRHSDNVSWRRVADDVVILDLETSAYFTLNRTAAFIWEKLGAGYSVDDISAALVREYGVKAAEAERSVSALVQDLLKANALEPRAGGKGPSETGKDIKAPKGSGAGKGYLAPVMMVLGLLQQAIPAAAETLHTEVVCSTWADCTTGPCTVPF